MLKARHGFGCALGLVVVAFAINEGLRISYGNSPKFAEWLRAHSYLAETVVMILRACLWLLLAYIFSRIRSPKLFLRETGFQERPTFWGWLFACGAIGVGLLDLYFVVKGWSRSHQTAPSFYYSGRANWVLFLAYSIILSPFVEELVLRGFLYHAFRQSYGILVSTVLVLCVQAYFHWGLLSNDLIASILLITSGIALCIVREYTKNTWNCVAFHGVHNAIVLRQWPLCAICMLILLFSCVRSPRAKALSHEVVPNT